MVKKASGKAGGEAVPVTAPPLASPGFPIVGIGASAGGLEAFEQFFRACAADSGMAFVLVPHLDPEHESLLTEILQRSTRMPVVQALDQIQVAPNHVYVIPPNREMAILNGVLQLSVPEQARGQRMPIDAFLRSLAEDRADYAIGIILSGTATDGTLGLRAIMGAGGLCLVQDPASAKYDGMPRSAIGAGFASHVLPPGDMPRLLLELTPPWTVRQTMTPIAPEKAISGMNQVLLQVRSGTGQDFSLYKKSTISRRVLRRMTQHHIADTAVYARYLREHPAETQILFKELLINVTSFFRDPDAFVTLKQTIVPALLVGKPADYNFRVWVAGCATGEEAYSIAMVLRELMDENRAGHQPEFRAQIYATDLDDEAITVARAGCYPPNIAQDVTPERLRRFFIKDDGGYKVKKEIREMVVFAVQNVIKDPPFTKLDLLSCRNLLIYLEPELQNRLIPTFHYALKQDGVLFLSTSESIANHPELFAALDRKWKLYQAKPTVAASSTAVSSDFRRAEGHARRTAETGTSDKPKVGNVADLSNRALLHSYAPASVTTDVDGNILYVHGDTGKYLRPAPGPVTTNVVEMAREGLQLQLRAALLHAAEGEPTPGREVSLKTNGGIATVSISVRRLPGPQAGANVAENLLLVSFQDVAAPAQPATRRGRKAAAPTLETVRVAQLEHELAYAKENLQANMEEQQAFNEELKSANEELQSTNEELQSSNEELETSKEELQSLNEEVLTVNAELNAKVDQLNGIQNDMKNLLDNINAGTLFLDHQLVIRRYTRQALKIYRLIASDVGRPLGDINSNIEGTDLLAELQSVLDTLIPREREVRTLDGAWYLARIQPYRTLDNVIEGLVLTFSEVTRFKLASEAVQRSEAQLATAQEIARLGSWELDVATRCVHWSDEMFNIFGVPRIAKPMPLADVLDRLDQDERDRVAAAIQNSVDHQAPYDIEHRVTRQDGTTRRLRSRAITLADAAGRVTALIGVSLDITESRETETLKLGALQLARKLADAILNTVSEPVIVLDGDLRVVSASRSFYHHFRLAAEETLGRTIYDLGNGQWNLPALHRLIESIPARDQALEGCVLELTLPGVGPRRVVINARRIGTSGSAGSAIGTTELILLAMVAIDPLESR